MIITISHRTSKFQDVRNMQVPHTYTKPHDADERKTEGERHIHNVQPQPTATRQNK